MFQYPHFVSFHLQFCTRTINTHVYVTSVKVFVNIRCFKKWRSSIYAIRAPSVRREQSLHNAHGILKQHFKQKSGLLIKIFFCGKRDLQRFVAKDIQSRYRNLREMKDVFKELKVLGRKRKSRTSQINEDILETIFTSTSTFSSTILVTFFES